MVYGTFQITIFYVSLHQVVEVLPMKVVRAAYSSLVEAPFRKIRPLPLFKCCLNHPINRAVDAGVLEGAGVYILYSCMGVARLTTYGV